MRRLLDMSISSITTLKLSKMAIGISIFVLSVSLIVLNLRATMDTHSFVPVAVPINVRETGQMDKSFLPAYDAEYWVGVEYARSIDSKTVDKYLPGDWSDMGSKSVVGHARYASYAISTDRAGDVEEYDSEGDSDKIIMIFATIKGRRGHRVDVSYVLHVADKRYAGPLPTLVVHLSPVTLEAIAIRSVETLVVAGVFAVLGLILFVTCLRERRIAK